MMINPLVALARSIVATVTTVAVLRCALFVLPAPPNVASSGGRVRRDMVFEAEPVGGVRREVCCFEMWGELDGIGEMLLAQRADDLCGDGIIPHLLDNLALRTTVIQGMPKEMFLEGACFVSAEPALALLQVAFPRRRERAEYLEKIAAGG